MSESRDLLFSCLRFRPRDADGNVIAGEPVPYDERFDDRDPVSFVFPDDLPHSSGANQVWNAVVTIDHDADVDAMRMMLVHLRRLAGPDADPDHFQALTDAARWLHDYDGI